MIDKQEFRKKLEKRCGAINEAIFDKTYGEIVGKKLETEYNVLQMRMRSLPEEVEERGFELFCVAYNYNLTLYKIVSGSKLTSCS